MAMTAAMKNVLSPISDAPMTPAAYKRGFQAIQAAAAAGYLTQPPEKQAESQSSALAISPQCRNSPIALIRASKKRLPAVAVMVPTFAVVLLAS
jgi:hypothetical protein